MMTMRINLSQPRNMQAYSMKAIKVKMNKREFMMMKKLRWKKNLKLLKKASQGQ